MKDVIKKLIIEVEEGITLSTRQEGNTIIIKAVKDHNEIAITDLDYKLEICLTKKVQKTVEVWFANQIANTSKQKKYLTRLKKALKSDICNGQTMKVIEPSRGRNGNIIYQEGKSILKGLSYNQWRKKFSEMSGRIATLYEYDIFLAYLMAKANIQLKRFADDSSNLGNYWNESKTNHKIDVSGAKKVAGCGFGIGNTYKIVSNPENKNSFALCGGSYLDYGSECPICYVGYDDDKDYICNNGVGVLVL